MNNEFIYKMRTKLIIFYIHMRLILFIGIYVIKYQIIAHFREWVGAYLRGAYLLNALQYVGV